jgi:hypothetical protein
MADCISTMVSRISDNARRKPNAALGIATTSSGVGTISLVVFTVQSIEPIEKTAPTRYAAITTCGMAPLLTVSLFIPRQTKMDGVR